MMATTEANNTLYSQLSTTTTNSHHDINEHDDVFNEDATPGEITTSACTTGTPASTGTISRDVNDPHLDNYIGRPRSRSIYATTRPLVYITRRVPQRGVDILLPTCNVSQWDSEEAVPRGELLQNVQGVHGILCLPSDSIDLELLNAAGSNLGAVATLSDHTRHIDVEECARRNIRVLCCPPPDLSAQADLTVALVLLTLRSVAAGNGVQLDNQSHQSSCLLSKVTGEGRPVDVRSAWWSQLTMSKTFGVYGSTSLARAVAQRLGQLGISNIILANFGVSQGVGVGVGEASSEEEDTAQVSTQVVKVVEAEEEDFEHVSRQEFLEQADIICVCGAHALTQKEAEFDHAAFRAMKSDAILVNSDSGHALNYTALYEALRDGQICAAGLNVCNQTPVPFQYPLQGLRNCVFMTQTQEDRQDIRHKITVEVTTRLLNVLKEIIQEV